MNPEPMEVEMNSIDPQEQSIEKLTEYLSKLDQLSESISNLRNSHFPKLFATVSSSSTNQNHNQNKQQNPPSEEWKSTSNLIKSDIVQIKTGLNSCEDILNYVKKSSTLDPIVPKPEPPISNKSTGKNEPNSQKRSLSDLRENSHWTDPALKRYKIDLNLFKKVEDQDLSLSECVNELNKEDQSFNKLKLISEDFLEVKGFMRVRLLLKKTDKRVIERAACFSLNETNKKIYQQSSYELFRSISRCINRTINKCPIGRPNLILITSLIASYTDFYSNSIKLPVINQKPPNQSSSLLPLDDRSNNNNQEKATNYHEIGIEKILLTWRILRFEKEKDDRKQFNGVWEPINEYGSVN